VFCSFFVVVSEDQPNRWQWVNEYKAQQKQQQSREKDARYSVHTVTPIVYKCGLRRAWFSSFGGEFSFFLSLRRGADPDKAEYI